MKDTATRKYLILAFSLSWFCWCTLAILTNFANIHNTDLLYILLFFIGGFGPPVATVLVSCKKINLKNISTLIFSHKPKTLKFFLVFLHG